MYTNQGVKREGERVGECKVPWTEESANQNAGKRESWPMQTRGVVNVNQEASKRVGVCEPGMLQEGGRAGECDYPLQSPFFFVLYSFY